MTQQKRIFITGGASGLGKAIAECFARDGYKVCIGDINEVQGASAAQDLQAIQSDAIFLPCDVTKFSDLENVRDTLIEQWGGVDIVVNNAGVAGTAGGVDEVPMDDWEWVLDINLLGTVRGCKAFSPLFIREKSGHFVNIASAAGLMNAPRMSNYNVSKAGVISLSETLRVELGHYGVSVSVVCPGFFPTNLAGTIRSKATGTQEWVEKLMQKSGISAEYVAKLIFESVVEKKFWVLPHKEEKRLWTLKRWFPEMFFRQMVKKTQKLFAQPHKAQG